MLQKSNNSQHRLCFSKSIYASKDHGYATFCMGCKSLLKFSGRCTLLSIYFSRKRSVGFTFFAAKLDIAKVKA